MSKYGVSQSILCRTDRAPDYLLLPSAWPLSATGYPNLKNPCMQAASWAGYPQVYASMAERKYPLDATFFLDNPMVPELECCTNATASQSVAASFLSPTISEDTDDPTIVSSISSIKHTARTLDDFLHIVLHLRHCADPLSRQDIAKLRKSLSLALELLIVPHRDLDKFAGIDVWIPPFLDVINDVRGYCHREVWRRVGQCDEVVYEACSGLY